MTDEERKSIEAKIAELAASQIRDRKENIAVIAERATYQLEALRNYVNSDVDEVAGAAQLELGRILALLNGWAS